MVTLLDMGKSRQKDMVKTSVALPRELWKLAHLRALDEGRDLQDVVASALEAYLLGAVRDQMGSAPSAGNLAKAVSAALRGERKTGSVLLKSLRADSK